MKRFALLAVPLALAACGDNDENRPLDAAITIDGPSIDGGIDAPTDAPTDGPPAVTYSGTISVLEAAVLNPGTSGTFFGQGVQVGIAFSSSADPAPMFEDMPGPFGCKAWVYTAAQAALVSAGTDEGSVQITTTGTIRPALPACTFSAPLGYACPHAETFGTGGVIGVGPQLGTATLSVVDGMYNAANTTNRYVKISGALTPSNNGVFPIVALASANTIIYGNPAVVAEATLPVASTHVNVAGIGPTPMVPDPGFLSDDATTTIVLTPPIAGPNHLPAFTMTTGATTVADDFTLAPASLALMNNIPRANADFALACATGSCADPTGFNGTLVNIIATDTPVAGMSPFAMPLPTTKRIQIRCAQIAPVTSITIPAALANLLTDPGITRIQTTFVRANLLGTMPVTAIAGHAIVGFTTPAAP